MRPKRSATQPDTAHPHTRDWQGKRDAELRKSQARLSALTLRRGSVARDLFHVCDLQARERAVARHSNGCGAGGWTGRDALRLAHHGADGAESRHSTRDDPAPGACSRPCGRGGCTREASARTAHRAALCIGRGAAGTHHARAVAGVEHEHPGEAGHSRVAAGPAARVTIASEAALENALSAPSAGLLASMRATPGDIVILGAAGKMGPTLSRMARRALDELGSRDRVIAVSRFSSAMAEQSLHECGIETIRCDLLDRGAVEALPDAPNIIFMAGQKFGTRDTPSSTWAMNVVLPSIAADRYAQSRVVSFSTGNVYPLSPVASGGSRETAAPAPIGEYAMSCLGRERIFEDASARRGTRVAIVRLNYAIDLRYGVLVDIAFCVAEGRPVPLAMGHVNVIWQGAANRAALALLEHASSPPLVVNVP